jgi:hypothetical protein
MVSRDSVCTSELQQRSTLDGSSTVELMHIKDVEGPGPAEHIPDTSTEAWR